MNLTFFKAAVNNVLIVIKNYLSSAVAEVNQQRCSKESGLWLEIVDQT